MAEIKGIVTKITFQNEESGFTVLRLKDEKTNDFHICVGIMPTIDCGESIKAHGEWTNNKRFGIQFNVKSYELLRPTTIEGIRTLLSSGLISDIGPIRAQNIIETFGTETLNILDNDPKQLIKVQGIGEKRKNNIAAFQLHQATERYYSALLLVLTDYKPKTHDIKKLGKLAAAQEPILLEVFPQGTEEERKRFELLRKAYVDARYEDDYKITLKELKWLGARVKVLQDLTQSICKEKIESFNK